MAKIKLIDVTISADEYNLISNHYSRMGFEQVNKKHYSGTKYRGTISSENFTVGAYEYDYYECLYQFNTKQKNAKVLWKIYQKYKKKNRELDRFFNDKNGAVYIRGISFAVSTALFMLCIMLLFPLVFGNDIGDYYTLQDALWDVGGSVKFDYGWFSLGAFISLVFGLPLAALERWIWSSCTRGKRLQNAIKQIPILEKEIEALAVRAYHLRAR